MPNALAFLMLALWPIVALLLFQRMTPERALIWTVLGGYLFLPPIAAFNLPMVPDLDKVSIPNLSAFFSVTVVLGLRVPILPQSILGRVLLLLFVIAPFGTVLNNAEAVTFAYPNVEPLPELRLYDSVAALANQAILLLPFFVARRLLATPEAMRELMIALVVAGLIYSLPILIEVRLSPQINIWVYGFFQHSFEQMMRLGGFRPIVFLQHGIWVAFFVLMTLVAAVALMRRDGEESRLKYLVIVLYLGVVLVLCKTMGTLVYALALVPLTLMTPSRFQIRVAAVLGLMVVAYPILRGAGLIPVDDLLALARSIDPERARSLGFRFTNEAMLLEHASQKPLFGWGGYERNLVHDPLSGQAETVADGRWIIVLGMFGWTGYIAEFGLLALPLVLLYRAARSLPMGADCVYAAPLALILAFNMVDMLPNATLIPFTWLIAGAILGYAENLRAAPARLLPRAASAPRTIL